MDAEDDFVPLSQLANEAFNPVAPHGTQEAPAIDFSRLGAALAGDGPAQSGGDAQPAAEAAHQWLHKGSKLFEDPVHEAFRLDPACTLVFDTRQFQRLRRLKQLGLSYYVFPGASHNRFEHSLGVAHLADKFATHLWRMQRGELDIERQDLRLVQLAGLCHDLGHGPWSHLFEREFLRQKGIHDWEHEAMSAAMLEHLIDCNHIDALSGADVKRIQRMILAGHGGSGAPPPGQGWLFEIVANGRNGIDVDKFDYLARDSMYCGIKQACNFNRIMQFSKVIGDEICFKHTETMNVYELFHARASMHRQVYTHKKAKAIEFMVVDALLEADSVLRITEKIRHPADFQLLDDGMLDWIENHEAHRHLLSLEPEDEAALRAAQAIISRLRRRELYQFVSDALIPQEHLDRGRWVPPTAQDIVNSYRGNGVQLRAEDVILQENKIDYSARDRNPLDSVSWFDDLRSQGKRKLQPGQISSMMVLACHQENTLRVYSRNASPQYVRAVHQAFDAWIRGRFGSKVFTSTPCKAPLPPPGSAAGAAGGKRSRGLFAGGRSDDDVSPSNLMKTSKQPRQ